MNLGINGKTAIVTASSGGLGEFAARALAAEGVNLVMFARSADTLRAKAADIAKQQGVKVLPVAGDMRIAADVDRLIYSNSVIPVHAGSQCRFYYVFYTCRFDARRGDNLFPAGDFRFHQRLKLRRR